MAPEQAQAGAGRVGPATDVWALGAILYECLTGQPPFLAETSLDTLRQVIGEEPMPPSQRRAGVPRDLEVVCLKCLEKQPQQRYASAEALADDLRRFLDDEPIHARPVGRLERLVKWVRRRPALAALALVSVLALAGVVGLELRHSARVRVERDRAEQSLALSLEAVNKLMTEVSEEHLADEPHLEEYRRVMLTRALAYYQRLLDVHGDDPRLREETAEAARRKGDALRLLAQYTEAEEAYREAIDRFDQLARQGEGRSYRLTLAGCYTDLGEVLSLTDRTAASRREYDHALEVEERLLEQDRQDPACLQERARTLYNLGILLRKSGQLQEAKQSLGQAVVVLKGLTGRFEDRPRYWQHLARSHLNLGTALRDAKEHLKARASCGEAITILEKMTRRWPRVPDYKHELAVTRNNLGNLLGDRKLYKEALAEHDEARALFAKLAEDFPRVPKYRLELANTYNSRGRVLSQQGDLAGARQAREQARERLEKLVREPDAPPSYHADLGRTYGNLGVVFYKQAEQEKARGHTDRERHHRQDARDHFRKAIRHLEEARGSNRDNPDYLLALRENYRSLAETVLQLHEDREAAEAARSLAAVAAGLPRETYFAACFMARCAAASGGEERQQRIALALQYLQQAVDAGFNDLPLFEKDCKDKFAILEKEKAFLTISQKLRVRAEQKRLPDSPKR